MYSLVLTSLSYCCFVVLSLHVCVHLIHPQASQQKQKEKKLTNPAEASRIKRNNDRKTAELVQSRATAAAQVVADL